MARKLMFWGLFLLALNALSIVSEFTLIFRKAITPDRIWSFGVGVAMQLPLLILLAVAHSLLEQGLMSLLKERARPAIILCTSMFLCTLSLFYITAQMLFLQVVVFPSMDVYAVLWNDTAQLIGMMMEGSALVLVATVLLGLAFFTVAGWICHLRNRPFVERRIPLCWGIWGAFYGTSVLLLGGIGVLSSQSVVALGARSYPTAFVCSALLGYAQGSGEKVVTPDIDVATLTPVQALDEYKAANPSPQQLPNIFFIMLESVSSDHVGFNGYARSDLTPHLDALSDDALIFENVFATSNHSNYSQTSTHGSQYPRRGPYLDHFLDLDYPRTLLFDLLPEYGYKTAFVSAQNEDWQGMSRYIRKGTEFDYFFHALDAPPEARDWEMKVDDVVAREHAEAFMTTAWDGTPLFLYLNFQRTHYPYRLPDGAPTPYVPWDGDFQATFFDYDPRYVDVMRNRYDNALHYVDGQVGAFLDFLKKQDLYDDALIVVTADHGEAFLEQGYRSHGTSLFNDQVRTFLLAKLPGNGMAGRRTEPISLVDVNPSILEVLGLGTHPNFQGRPVFYHPQPGRMLFMTSQGVIHADGVVRDEWKFIRSRREGERLVNWIADPQERADVSAYFPDVRAELEAALDRYIAEQLAYYRKLPREVRSNHYPPQYE